MSRKNRRKRRKKDAAPSGPRPPAFLDRLAGHAERLARTRWGLPAILVALSVAIYARSLPMPLVEWDDDVYLFEDPRLQNLSPGNVGRLLVRPFFANYHPVATLTYAFDRALWGKWLPGYRMTHLAFYAGGVVLLYYLFRMLLGSRWGALAAAAVYATHAIHVESVAWLAQRKDVVCLVFYSASILAYIAYSRRGDRRWRLYAASLGFAALACLSKGYAVVLPAVLLAYDLCFAERTGWRRLLDKLPFLAISAAAIAFTVLAQNTDSALVESTYTGWQRLAMLCRVFTVYVGKTILPVRLSGLYMVGKQWPAPWTVPAGLALGAGAVAGFVLLRRRRPAVAFGIALFLLPLATVMNVFFTLRIWIADRYLFLPTVGSSLALAAVGLRAYRRASAPRRRADPRADRASLRTRWALGVSAACVVGLYSALTVARISAWSGPVPFWSDAVRKHTRIGGSGPVTARDLARADPRRLNPQIILMLAQAYGRAGDEKAAGALLAGVRRPTERADASELLVRARVALSEGRHEDAEELALKVARGGTFAAPRGWSLAGLVRVEKGDLDAAREAFLEALRLCRESGRSGADIMLDLGLLELRAGDPEKAAEWYRRAREAAPEDHRAAFGLAMACERAGRLGEAVTLYEEVLRRAPDHPQRKAIAATIRRLREARPEPTPDEGRE